MESTQNESSLRNDAAADVQESSLEPLRPALRARRPAELTAFIASLVIAAGAFGLSLSSEVVVAGFVLIGGLPAVLTWAVQLYRDTLRDLGS